MVFIKNHVKPLEIELQQLVANKYEFSPRILQVDGETVTMETVDGKTLSELFTDNSKLVPDWVWQQIYTMLAILFEREGIEYVDISAYNFMVNMNLSKVYMIDFGHATYTKQNKGQAPRNWFLKAFLDEEIQDYNPDFA